MIALDASALLAFLFREAGHEKVSPHISSALLSTVNLSEVLGRVARDGHDPLPLLDRLRRSPIAIVPFTAEHAARAAALLPSVHPLGLSLGDRACLALAQAEGIPALTADRAWAGLDLGIEVVLVR